nr:MAG TPA: hypothetical protein [Caudoviricetes sp.]
MSIETLLREEIQDEITGLGKLELGSEAYKTTVDGVTKLLDRANEAKKIDAEARDRAESREIETQLKNEQMQCDRKDRIVKNVLTALSIGGGFALTIWGSIKSWKFEETGTVTNGPGREFMKKLFRMKG